MSSILFALLSSTVFASSLSPSISASPTRDRGTTATLSTSDTVRGDSTWTVGIEDSPRAGARQLIYGLGADESDPQEALSPPALQASVPVSRIPASAHTWDKSADASQASSTHA